MYKSRLGRFEEKKQRSRIAFAVIGSIGLLVFLWVFGLKILIAFSVFVDKLRGSGPKVEEQVILFPPEIDPLPEATNSAQTWITGRADPKLTLLLFVNDEESKKVTVEDDGTFRIEKITLKEGVNTISAKVTNEKNQASELSEIQKVTFKKSKPKLEVTSPNDGATIEGDKQYVDVMGKTDEGNTVTINDRFVVVSSNGSFTYTLNLNEGEQTYKLIAKDIAGNETALERKITYRK